MRIGIDCRKVADYGIGTYIRGLTRALASLPGEEEYVLFCAATQRNLLPSGDRFLWIEERSPNYSLRELVAMSGHRVDLFHAPHYVVPFGRTAVVVTIHDLIHLNQPRKNPMERWYAKVMIGRAVRKSAAILTVSHTAAEDIGARYPGAASKIVVTPNGVNERFTPGDHGPSADYFLFVGNDKPHKNLATLLSAFGEVRRSERDARLILVGGARADQDGVVARGFVADEELPDLYRGAIALVIPSIEEGFGLPLMEAMACGTPVIASRAGALVEIAAGAALHVEARDSAAMAEAMMRIMREESLRLKMRRDGIERARDFSWLRCAERTLRVYRSTWNNVEQAKS